MSAFRWLWPGCRFRWALRPAYLPAFADEQLVSLLEYHLPPRLRHLPKSYSALRPELDTIAATGSKAACKPSPDALLSLNVLALLHLSGVW